MTRSTGPENRGPGKYRPDMSHSNRHGSDRIKKTLRQNQAPGESWRGQSKSTKLPPVSRCLNPAVHCNRFPFTDNFPCSPQPCASYMCGQSHRLSLLKDPGGASALPAESLSHIGWGLVTNPNAVISGCSIHGHSAGPMAPAAPNPNAITETVMTKHKTIRKIGVVISFLHLNV